MLSWLSRVSSRSSTGMPCRLSASSPTMGPPRFVMYGIMLGVRPGQSPGLTLPVVRSTFWLRFHTSVLKDGSTSFSDASRRKSMSMRSSTRSVCARAQSVQA